MDHPETRQNQLLSERSCIKRVSAPNTDGSRDIEWVGVDVDLVDLNRGLALLKGELIALKVPLGTVLEFESAGQKVELTKPFVNMQTFQRAFAA